MPSVAKSSLSNPKGGGAQIDSDANQFASLIGKAVNDHPPEKPYSIAIGEAPVTGERQPYYPNAGSRLLDPGTARANVAASSEAPNGTPHGNWTRNHQCQTVLQQHAAYWDGDGDGIIWPHHIHQGVRAWGWAVPLCLLATFVISVSLSYPTGPSVIPDPLFRIHLANLHKDKHGSDSMTFDNEGRFRPQNFEDFFAKYDRGNKGGLDIWDLIRAHKGQRMAFDFFGWSATLLEWLATYLLLWPEDGVLRKDDVRKIFDGSIFQVKADDYAERQRKTGKQKGFFKQQ